MNIIYIFLFLALPTQEGSMYCLSSVPQSVHAKTKTKLLIRNRCNLVWTCIMLNPIEMITFWWHLTITFVLESYFRFFDKKIAHNLKTPGQIFVPFLHRSVP